MHPSNTIGLAKRHQLSVLVVWTLLHSASWSSGRFNRDGGHSGDRPSPCLARLGC